MTLVTGAGGFLGGYIATALGDAGHQVTRATRDDLAAANLEPMIAGARPEVVVHCAGPASVGDSLLDPLADFRGSAELLAELLDGLRSAELRPRFLLLSSAAVYGSPERLPVAEDAQVAPISPYGFHRAASELVLAAHHRSFGLPAATLRIFSAYGEGLRRQLLWDVCAKALGDGEIRLGGTGEETRDFVHARDVAQAVVRVVASGAFEGEAYNVGTGSETSVRAIALLLAAELGIDRALVSFDGKQRAGDPAHWRADVGRLVDLGYSPQVDIEAGAPNYARWVKDSAPAGPDAADRLQQPPTPSHR